MQHIYIKLWPNHSLSDLNGSALWLEYATKIYSLHQKRCVHANLAVCLTVSLCCCGNFVGPTDLGLGAYGPQECLNFFPTFHLAPPLSSEYSA